VEAVNARLKAGQVGVQALQVGNRLRLQATLPPKPGAGRDRPYQQQIALGIYANRDGLEEAETRARELGVLLARGSLSWISSELGGTCGDWHDDLRHAKETCVRGFIPHLRVFKYPLKWRSCDITVSVLTTKNFPLLKLSPCARPTLRSDRDEYPQPYDP
jgi:hypothetical protein